MFPINELIILNEILYVGFQDVDGMVRLVDGDGVRSGRVDIFHNDSWGAVLDRDWDIHDATTVCRQFGFLEALEANNDSFFGESDLPVVMDRVACKVTENQLTDCQFVCTSSQQYNHSHEAGVVCKPHLGRPKVFSSYTVPICLSFNLICKCLEFRTVD